MANGVTSMTRSNRAVSVDVGVSPVRRQDAPPPAICVVGLAGEDDPIIGEVFPRALVRNTRFSEDDITVEHVRLSSREAVGFLPGLDPDRPSLIRDAVLVALHAGAPSVDIVLARIDGLMPWDLDRPEVTYALEPFLSGMVGTSMLYPDIGGPIPLGPGMGGDIEERVDRLIRTVRAHGSRWAERYQLAFIDVPAVGGDLSHRLLRGASGTDCALTRWVGEPEEMVAHGWRSAGALVAGSLAQRPGEMLVGLAGREVALAPGRWASLGRYRDLALGDSWRSRLPEDEYFVDVEPDSARGSAKIHSDPTMRAPVGTWTVAAARLAKVIHWRVMQAASRFVFESADVGRAIALATAVTRAIEPFSSAGVLVGPDGSGDPAVRGGVVRNPASPGLRVELGAVLLPWSQRVSVRVNLRPGATPVVEEVA